MKRISILSLFLPLLLAAILLTGCPDAEPSSNEAINKNKTEDRNESGDSESASDSVGGQKAADSNSTGKVSDGDSPSALAKTAKSSSTPSSPEPKTVVPPEPDVNDTKFHADILAATDEYLRYALVDTSVNLAIADCSPASDPPAPRLSQAEGESGHAQKLYFLFAKDIAHYFNAADTPSPVGQTVVKEAWTSKPSNPEARNLRRHASANRINPRVTVDDKTLEIGKRTNLFVMIKQDQETSGTDEGWVYGVVDAESNEVLAAGAVASCMACHTEQEDRLFRADHIFVIDEQVVEEGKGTGGEADKGTDKETGDEADKSTGETNSKKETER